MSKKVKKILANFYQPRWWTETAFPYLQSHAVRNISELVYSPPRDPEPLMDMDWDNVIILDGCRYDLFEGANTIDGQLDYRISLGSATPEFLMRNFGHDQYHDTVYVTANPMYRKYGLGDVFHNVNDVWESHWDEKLNTVRPEAVAEATKTADKRYPNKRIISHFMQPHYPFIGELADEIGDHSGYELSYREVTEGKASRDAPTVWDRLKRGELSQELVWNAYQENLELTLPHVRELIKQFGGKTAVTSDHGNLVGEQPFPLSNEIYGHPMGIRHRHLCRVPWFVVEDEERKEIVEEETSEQSVGMSKTVSDRLSDLGYVDT